MISITTFAFNYTKTERIHEKLIKMVELGGGTELEVFFFNNFAFEPHKYINESQTLYKLN